MGSSIQDSRLFRMQSATERDALKLKIGTEIKMPRLANRDRTHVEP